MFTFPGAVRRCNKRKFPTYLRGIFVNNRRVFTGSRTDALRDMPGFECRLLRQTAVSVIGSAT